VIRTALEAADDREAHVQDRGNGLEGAAGSTYGFVHAPAIDDPELAERAQVGADGFGNPGRKPGGVWIAGDVGKVENRNGPRVRRRGLRRRCDLTTRRDRRDGRDEAVAAAGNRLDVLRRRRIVSKRLPQLGDRLRECVVGDVGARPQRIEQRFLGDELPGVVEQVEQQVEQLRRQVQRITVPGDAIRGAIDVKRTEAIGGWCQADILDAKRRERAPRVIHGAVGHRFSGALRARLKPCPTTGAHVHRIRPKSYGRSDPAGVRGNRG
jgi:hypothetical protein